MDIKILFEDEAMVIALKPQGVPTQPDKTGDPDLLSALEEKTDAVLGLLHRLDRPVGGLLVFSKNNKAHNILAKEMEQGVIKKRYLAVLCGELPKAEGTAVDYLKKNMRTNLSSVVPPNEKGAKKAVLHYRRLETTVFEDKTLTLAEITLETGRHHQIRVQTANFGAPIWGDKKYNPMFSRDKKSETALWAYSLEGLHPFTEQPWSYTIFPEGEIFRKFTVKK